MAVPIPAQSDPQTNSKFAISGCPNKQFWGSRVLPWRSRCLPKTTPKPIQNLQFRDSQISNFGGCGCSRGGPDACPKRPPIPFKNCHSGGPKSAIWDLGMSRRGLGVVLGAPGESRGVLEGSRRAPGGVPGGSWEAPGRLPEGSRGRSRTPRRPLECTRRSRRGSWKKMKGSGTDLGLIWGPT